MLVRFSLPHFERFETKEDEDVDYSPTTNAVRD